MSKIRLRKMRGFWGEYNPDNDQISLDNTLTKTARPSKPAVYFHEEYHKYIKEKGIELPHEEEELKCEIYSLMMCRKAELSYLEAFLKRNIIAKYGKLSKSKIAKMDKFI